MTTEILGFLIIVGAIIVVIARRQMQQAENDTEVIEASAGRLRYELEQSADEIISRMAGHIDHLETLLQEADYKADLLERRMDEFKQLQMDVQAQRQINIGENVAQLTGNRDLENLPGGDEHDDFAKMSWEYTITIQMKLSFTATKKQYSRRPKMMRIPFGQMMSR